MNVTRMPVVYIAGPYRSEEGEYDVRQNIRTAEGWASFFWVNGLACIVPHKNTAGMGGLMPDDFWLKSGLALLERCDAMFVMPNSEASQGTQAEIVHARKVNVPVFENKHDLLKYFEDHPTRVAEPADMTRVYYNQVMRLQSEVQR